jgi:hypothetical protein
MAVMLKQGFGIQRATRNPTPGIGSGLSIQGGEGRDADAASLARADIAAKPSTSRAKPEVCS